MANQPVASTALHATVPLIAPVPIPQVSDIVLVSLPNKGNFKGTVYELGLNHHQPFDLIILHRQAGLVVPPHFHTGSDLSFKPQVAYCLAGQMTIKCLDLLGNHRTIIFRMGDKLTLPAFISHGYTVDVETVIAEVRQQPFDPKHSDTYDEASFKEVQKPYV